jgi:acetylornithine deacetylase/succinyl-diaminopimelate desuccinylase-like protein
MDLGLEGHSDARRGAGGARSFVPCKDGISHNEAESATRDDLADGARGLTEVIAELADV